MKKGELKRAADVALAELSAPPTHPDPSFLWPRSWISEEKEAILDYLHHQVPDEEIEAATFYEFAREDASFKFAAQLHKQGKDWGEIWAAAEAGRGPEPFSYQIAQLPSSELWTCAAFPDLPWSAVPEEVRKVSNGESAAALVDGRKAIAPHFVGIIKHFSLHPLNVLKASMLKGMGVFNKFDALATQAAALAAATSEHLPAVEHIVFTLNFTGGKDALVNEFRKWLENNRAKQLQTHGKPRLPRGEGSRDWFHTRLKYLTAARLCTTLGFDEAKKWTEKNQRRTGGPVEGFGVPVPWGRQKVRKNRNPQGAKRTTDPKVDLAGPLYHKGEHWKRAAKNARKSFHQLLGH